MAKLPGMTCDDMRAIAGQFWGVVDFYFWNGIACARVWPEFKKNALTEASKEAAAAFGAIAQRRRTLPAAIVFEYEWLTGNTTWTWCDLYTSDSMAYFRGTRELPPEIVDAFSDDSEPPPVPPELLCPYQAYCGDPPYCQTMLPDLPPCWWEGCGTPPPCRQYAP